MTPPSNLIERLGFSSNDRAVIVNADDFGMSRSAVRGISSLLRSSGVDSTTLMTPCGWAPAAARTARENPHFDVGVHLTFTSEWEDYRWGPVSCSSSTGSLVDANGYFPQTCLEFEVSALEEEVAAEIEAQIARARSLGVNPTHADNHMGSLYGLATGKDFLEVTLKSCAEHGLPFRLPRSSEGVDIPDEIRPLAQQLLAARCGLADELGVVLPDYTWTYAFETEPGTTYESVKQEMMEMIACTNPGVTEIYVHPFEVDDELLDISPNPAKRGWELSMFRDPDVLNLFTDLGIHRIGWRNLQDVQTQIGVNQ